MSKFRLVINPAGFNEARRDPAIQADLEARADRIVAAAGGDPDFIAIPDPNGTRSRVVVVTATARGKALEARDRALTRALDAGRG